MHSLILQVRLQVALNAAQSRHFWPILILSDIAASIHLPLLYSLHLRVRPPWTLESFFIGLQRKAIILHHPLKAFRLIDITNVWPRLRPHEETLIRRV